MTPESTSAGWIGHGLSAADAPTYNRAYAGLCASNNNAAILLPDDEEPVGLATADHAYTVHLTIGAADTETFSGDDLGDVLARSLARFAALDGLPGPVTYALETTLLRVHGPLGHAIDEVEQMRARLSG
ncbi:hypothetical protein [Nocardia sp. IFM 10818]